MTNRPRRGAGGAPCDRRTVPPLVEWVLLVALLPSLAFLGHWTLQISIPGTEFYLGLPGPAAQDYSAGGDHEAHCHGDSASCSSAPFAGASAVAVLSQSAAFLGAAAALIALATLTWRPSRELTLAPDRRPPRALTPVLA